MSPTDPVKVLIVDDHPVARRGLSVIVEASLPGAVVLEADGGRRVMELARNEEPELVLLDARMPDSIPARELCAHLRLLLPEGHIAVVTAFEDLAVIRDCLTAGASGCLLKDTSEIDLGAALKDLLRGRIVIDPRISEKLAREFVSSHSRDDMHLTSRERDVLALLAKGFSNRQIAGQLHLSEATVKGYVTHLLKKLNVSSRLEAVVQAHENGLLQGAEN